MSITTESAFKRIHQTREEWLNDAVTQFVPLFDGIGVLLSDKIRVSVGFCSTGRRSSRVGECWSDKSSADGHFEIFIRPEIFDPIKALDILAHELVHVAVGTEAAHGKIFKRAALAIGLTGRMRSTVAGPELTAKLHEIRGIIGDFPHAALNGSNRKKQTTRLVKCTCPSCGYTVRTTRSWIEIGLPHCPQHSEMMEG